MPGAPAGGLYCCQNVPGMLVHCRDFMTEASNLGPRTLSFPIGKRLRVTCSRAGVAVTLILGSLWGLKLPERSSKRCLN